ncbi:MAG: tRNA uridine-5-carboxymethylaminomethyl(34) synthesis GTPase MnmE [Rhodobiaceae bacterium]|nr:tRNA uridine-5-carboxymethylaminomethyl(34) synthesis GTPase MnmE [Rhodobiaceae bacterium]
MSDETIFALSTASARAALAVVRLSGPACDSALVALGVTRLPPPRMAGLRTLAAPQNGALLDEALVLRFQAPHSFTGEAMAELHLHGGLAIVESVLAALSALPGLRAAEAGEFTRRAVLNGKMDLTAAEAIADLIDAEGGAQQKQALAQLRGGLRRRAEGWREGLKTLLAHLEADLEFADEDLPGGIGQKALDGLPALQAELSGALSDDTGMRLRDGLRVALVGPPNAGKSSILNMLAGRAAAIVSARAGTTRDAIEVAMLLEGVPLTLIDTAGLRAAGDDIEREGVRRALASAEEADIVIWVDAPDVADDAADDMARDWRSAADMRLANKSDVARPDDDGALRLSAKTGDGAEALLAALGRLVLQKTGSGESAPVTRARHVAILREVLAHIEAAQQADALELAAEDLRLAQRALGRMTGTVDVEQLLDVVFADFCIGK